MPISGIEFTSSNLHVAFPFAENASGLVYDTPAFHGAGAKVPLAFLADANIIAPATYTSFSLDSITRMLDGTTYRFRFSSGGTIVFTYDLASLPDIPRFFAIVEMQSSTSDIVIKLVITQVFKDYLAEIAVGDSDLFNDTLPFERTVVTPVCNHVTAFRVETLPDNISGDVIFEAGYNTEIRIGTTIDSTTLDIAFSPGSGLGLWPCEAAQSNKLSSGLIPDANGNVEIEPGDECYKVIPHPSAGKIELQGDCYPCCTCDMYIRVGNAMKLLAERELVAKQTLLGIQARLTSAIIAYNLKVKNKALLILLGGTKGTVGAARMHGTLGVQCLNQSNSSITVTAVRLSLPGGLSALLYPPGSMTIASGATLNLMYELLRERPSGGSWTIGVTVTYTMSGTDYSWSGSISI